MAKAKVENVAPPRIALLKKRLNAYPAFAEVDHARFPLTDDEPRWQADVLQFSFRDRPYYASFDGNGKVVIHLPGERSRFRPVGKPIDFEALDLAADIARMIDATGHE